MKIAFLAAALMVGGAAYAQDTTGQGSTDPSMSSGGGTVAAGNTAPKRDARGIPVVSADAMAPAGWNSAPGMGGANPSAAAPAQGSSGPLPPCTRRVTDHCTQTYERHHGDSGMSGGGDMAATTDAGASADATTTTPKATHRRRHRR